MVLCNNLGKVSIRSFEDFDKKVKTLKGPKEWIQAAKFSPCENYLAIGSHDDHLFVYQIDEATHEYSLYDTSHKHSSFINGLDWTADSKEIRTCSGDYEVLYYNMESKEVDPHGS